METEIIVEKEEMVLDLAGAGSRLISYLIDGIIVGVIGSILNYVSMNVGGTLGGILAFLGVLVSLAYFT